MAEGYRNLALAVLIQRRKCWLFRYPFYASSTNFSLVIGKPEFDVFKQLVLGIKELATFQFVGFKFKPRKLCYDLYEATETVATKNLMYLFKLLEINVHKLWNYLYLKTLGKELHCAPKTHSTLVIVRSSHNIAIGISTIIIEMTVFDLTANLCPPPALSYNQMGHVTDLTCESGSGYPSDLCN